MLVSTPEVLPSDVVTPAVGPGVRPRMTSSELATWRSLLDTTAELRRVLGAELQQTGLSPADYQVLLALTEAKGKRMRSSELARTIDWERSRLSHHLGRLEKRRLIRRGERALGSRGAGGFADTPCARG